jgi:biopolymer transport protein ExbB/TolQ
MFSEYVLQGISESSVIYLTIGVGGYMLIGIVAFIAIYQIFFAYNTARRNDLKLSELRWKLDDVHREVKDLKQSLEK